MGKLRDGFSDFGFFNALPPTEYTTAIAGRTVDLKGYNTCTFLVVAGSHESAGVPSDEWTIILQHGLASAAGVSTWSNIGNSLMIHSVYGGYDSTASDGMWHSIALSTEAASTAVYAVGYKGDTTHRYVRIYLSVSGACSSFHAGAVAVLRGDWAINTPVNI